jgi:hypothetical protein
MRFQAFAFGLFLALAQEQPKAWPNVPYVPTGRRSQGRSGLRPRMRRWPHRDCPGTRGVGVHINPIRIREARLNAKQARVEDSVKFIEGDLFKATSRRPPLSRAICCRG